MLYQQELYLYHFLNHDLRCGVVGRKSPVQRLHTAAMPEVPAQAPTGEDLLHAHTMHDLIGARPDCHMHGSGNHLIQTAGSLAAGNAQVSLLTPTCAPAVLDSPSCVRQGFLDVVPKPG
eukprot:3810718-Amphidinium_carterae.1